MTGGLVSGGLSGVGPAPGLVSREGASKFLSGLLSVGAGEAGIYSEKGINGEAEIAYGMSGPAPLCLMSLERSLMMLQFQKIGVTSIRHFSSILGMVQLVSRQAPVWKDLSLRLSRLSTN